MATEAGWMNYFVRAAESAWGTQPGSPLYLQIPVTSSNLKATPNAVQAPLYTGSRQRKHSRITRVNYGGQIVMPFWGTHLSDGAGSPVVKSIAEWFIADAMSAPAGLDLNSFVWEMAENDVDNKRWNGCRINQMTIAGDSDSNAVTLTFDVIAQLETGAITKQAYLATQALPIEAIFDDCTFAYAGSAIELDKFSLTLNNNLQPKWVNSATMKYLTAGERHWNMQFDLVKTANTFDALRRSTNPNNATAQLVIKARHGGTATNTFTKLTLDIDVSSFIGADDQMDLNKLMTQSSDFIILKPNTTDNDVDATWTTV